VGVETETRPPSWDRADLPSATLGSWGRSRPRGQRWLLVVVAVVWAVGAGVAGWWNALPVRPAIASLHPDLVVMLPEASGLFDEEVHGAGTHHERAYSLLRVDVGDDPGQLLVELTYTGEQLPAQVPPRPRDEPELTVEQRYERDRAFLEGEDAYEQWQQEMGADEPSEPREPQPRGQVHVDREIDCVRLVVSTNDVADLDPALLDALVGAVEEYVAGWLEHPGVGQPCVPPWRSGHG
jgi:hypothetical protein